MSLYLYFNEEISDVIGSHNKTKIQFVVKMLNELVSSWRIIANKTNSPEPVVKNSLNIVS